MTDDPAGIVLVEDNPDHAELVLRSLRGHRIANRVVTLADGEVALDYLLRRGRFADPATSPRPHLILLDLRLPKVDGLEVLRTVKQTEGVRRIPVVVLTTSTSDRDVALASHHGANSYLVKPLDFADFTRLIDDLASYWLGWNLAGDPRTRAG